MKAVLGHEAGSQLDEVEIFREVHIVSEKTGERPGSFDTDPVDDGVELIEETPAVVEQEIDRPLEVVQQPGVACKTFEDFYKG